MLCETEVIFITIFNISYCCIGAVGLEALSRGCNESHFVEMDPAVTRDCLGKNIAACGLTSLSFVHSMVRHAARWSCSSNNRKSAVAVGVIPRCNI